MSNLIRLLDSARVRPLTLAGPDVEIEAVAVDSRRVRGGEAFFAMPGLRADGLSFVDDALRRGARAVFARTPPPAGLSPSVAWVHVEDPRRAAALVARECAGRPDEALTLVGITGTNGKTTVAFLVESIARAAGRKVGRSGTLGSDFAGEHHDQERTTPEAPDFYGLLADMVRAGVDLAAVEVSSHALALDRVYGARFRVAAFLNLGSDHLDFHGDRGAYLDAKARLFEGLGDEASAILPADAPEGERMAARTGARVVRFGRTERADVRLLDERTEMRGSSAVIETPTGRIPVRTFLPGRYNLDNIAAAAACSVAIDLPAESISAGVLACESIPGRMERVDRGQPFDVFIDFAHTPAALEALLGWLRPVVPGRVLVVFGCGGERDEGKRPEMGRIAAEAADRVFVTSDNPRGEDPEKIVDDVVRGALGVAGAEDRVHRVPERREAIRAAVERAEPGDAVVIAGKGHETVQTVGDLRIPFDDREVVCAALEQRGWARRA